jgi:hypothetical protein
MPSPGSEIAAHEDAGGIAGEGLPDVGIPVFIFIVGPNGQTGTISISRDE